MSGVVRGVATAIDSTETRDERRRYRMEVIKKYRAIEASILVGVSKLGRADSRATMMAEQDMTIAEIASRLAVDEGMVWPFEVGPYHDEMIDLVGAG